MRTEQPTKYNCLYHISYRGWGCRLKTSLSPLPLVIHYWPFQGGGYDVVSVVHNTFSAIWVAEWPPLWKLLPARLAIWSHSPLSIFNFYLFPFFESRSGLVSFQTDHSIWCVLVAFLTRPKPHFKVLPGHLRYLACAIYYNNSC